METQSPRWSAKRKVELLLALEKGERKRVDVCREHDLRQSEVDLWMETFLRAGERQVWRKPRGHHTDRIASQRDVFGPHGFTRLDQPGRHHTNGAPCADEDEG